MTSTSKSIAAMFKLITTYFGHFGRSCILGKIVSED